MTTQTLRNGHVTEFDDSCRAPLFGILADFASEILTSYRSDLYRDAEWIRHRFIGSDPITIVFGVRPGGTFIADATPENERVALANMTRVIRVHVKIGDGRCDVETTVIRSV